MPLFNNALGPAFATSFKFANWGDRASFVRVNYTKKDSYKNNTYFNNFKESVRGASLTEQNWQNQFRACSHKNSLILCKFEKPSLWRNVAVLLADNLKTATSNVTSAEIDQKCTLLEFATMSENTWFCEAQLPSAWFRAVSAEGLSWQVPPQFSP